MAAEAVVRARIDAETKTAATQALAAMGLSVSDAIRLLLTRVASEGELPFTVRTPNRVTRDAMASLERGEGERFEDVEAAFKALGL